MKMKNGFFLIICCFGLLSACNSDAQQTNLSVPEFEKAIAKSNIQLLDVRTAGEYQSGHLSDALLADWNNDKEFEKRAKALDKNKPVYTYCLSGARSNAAAHWLRQKGFTAYNLIGGINAWKRDNKPLVQAVLVKQITLQEYQVLIPKDKTVMVDFSAVWCPPCKKMAPVIDSLVKANGSQFVLVRVDGGDQTDICKELKVEGFPTFIIYRQGKEVWRKEGIVEAKEFVTQF